MPNKIFLETYPLYRKFDTDWRNSYNNLKLKKLPKPAIHMFCSVCNSEQTFNVINDYDEVENNNFPVDNKIIRAKYVCSDCKKEERIFIVRLFYRVEKSKDEEGEENECVYLSMQKVGQYPAWDIEMDKELKKILGQHADYYKKGLTCESHSYGIGAYSYFRRIAEDIIDELLNSIQDLIVDKDDQEKYQKALEEAKKTKVAEKKIELVQELLPASLIVEGFNPLKTLYGSLSVGLHGKTDDECMKQAEIIRGVLVYLVNQIVRTKKDKKVFTDGLKKLLDK